MHKAESTLKNGMHKILWDFEIQTDPLILARRPDIVLIDKKKKINKREFVILWILFFWQTTE